MENNELRNALLSAMKVEIARLANEQREQKKTRKLANRPEGKSLQSIVDEINERKVKIHNLITYYRWILHGKKYWINRGILSWKYYFHGSPFYPYRNSRFDEQKDDVLFINRVKEHLFAAGYEDYIDDEILNELSDNGDYCEYIDKIIFWE